MQKSRVAIQGIKASFHEEAAFKFFGEGIETVECNSFRETCEALKHGLADFTVMAIENSIAGSILSNYSLLRDYHFTIIGEVYLSIRLHLLGLPGVKFEQIKYVESHPIAIHQCADFFYEYPQLQVVESTDTAACAKKIRDNGLKDTAAIANELAAKVYSLNIMERRIETNKKNYTRFLILSRSSDQENKEANKASLSFQVGNEIGALAKILNIFAEENINMTKIQSMPVLGKRHEYNFYVDIEWKKRTGYDNAIRRALRYTVNFTIMGEYRKNDKV